MRVVPIPSASLPLFYLQTRRSETFGELTMRTVNSEKIHMDSTSYRSGLFPEQKLWPRRSAEQTIEQTSHCQERIQPRCSNERL